MLGIRKLRTTSFHPASNGCVERWHNSLHSGLSHYVNSTNTNWDILVPFFLMAYRATPNTTTGYRQFYLLHGREMSLHGNDTLKAKLPQKNQEHEQRLQTLKSSLKLAYNLVAKANRKSHQKNKRYYDRKAKPILFNVDNLIYLFNPACKPGLSRTFYKSWQGPYGVTKKMSDLNY